jgi:hypothetical protein
MSDQDLSVSSNVEDKVIVLTITYGPEQMLRPANLISAGLIASYESEKKGGNGPNCIVVVGAKTAGSTLVKALFELWERVTQEGGQVACANYPDDYIESIMTLGLPALDGFKLAMDKSEAFRKLRR